LEGCNVVDSQETWKSVPLSECPN